MPSYVVEVYLPGARASRLGELAAMAGAAAAELTLEGARVRYVRSVFVPADETCFVFFEAGSRDTVRRAIERAALPVDRMLEAIEHAPGP